MRYLSVCSGIEAASVAWGPLGWEPVAFAEIDPFASAVLAHRYPETPNLGDFTQIEAEPGSVDVLVGGTPCQSFSVAGLRGGMADARGNLALEFLRLAGRIRPEWVVWENVPGVLSSGGGRDFGSFLGGLAELGYGFAYRVLDAQFFGLAQRRKRVFVVGRLGDWRGPAAVLLERDGLSGHPPPRRGAGEEVAATLDARTTAGGFPRTDGACGGHVIPVPCVIKGAAIGREPHNGPQYGEVLEDGTCYTLNCTETHGVLHASPRDTAGSLRADAPGTQPCGSLVLEPAVAFIVNAVESCATRSHARPTETARCIDSTETFANAQGGTVVAYNIIGMAQEGRNHAYEADVSGCLQHKGLSASGNQVGTVVKDRSAVRRLTPRECERLQGFSDDWTLVPYRGKPVSDGPRYRAIGNSMAVPCMAWIGRRIQVVARIEP